MGQVIELRATDGHVFSAYEAKAEGKPKGGLVIVQEIFGVNAHIRSVADGYAAEGYHVLAPALFDRVERNYDHGYEPADVDAGRAVVGRMNRPDMLVDIAACVAELGRQGKVGIVGYCLGGSLAYLAASSLTGIACTVGYYGGMVAGSLDKRPRVPVMLHFGEMDAGIPVSDVEKIRASVDPKMVQVFLYEGAGHAFNRAGNKAWHGPSAKLARERTLAFLATYMT
jgi:carboxymethylenebutenolidase